jgi:hypothetical protein
MHRAINKGLYLTFIRIDLSAKPWRANHEETESSDPSFFAPLDAFVSFNEGDGKIRCEE